MARIKGVNEAEITRIIVRESLREWEELSSVDVVVVGAGPSGLTAAKYLAEGGLKTLVVERRLSFGGGMGGGGNLLHKVVVEYPANEVLDDFNVRYYEVSEGIYVVSTAELMAKLAAGAVDAGAKIIFGLTLEDLIFRYDPLRVAGAVVIWSAIPLAGLHVDPLFIESKAVIDATGHDAEVLSVAAAKIPGLLQKPRGGMSANAIVGEERVVELTGKVAPGLYATGIAVSSYYGTPRMGPIFGGMLLSGRKVAKEVLRDLKG